MTSQSLLRSAVILIGAVTFLWSFSSLGAFNFTATLSADRFNRKGPGNLFGDDMDESPAIGERRQFANTQMFEDLLWTLNFGFSLAVLVAGIYEIKALSIYGGVWMLLFSLGQIAIVSSYDVVRCPNGDNATINPEDPGCAVGAIDGFWAWYLAFTVLTVFFYLGAGVATIYFGTKCADDEGRRK